MTTHYMINQYSCNEKICINVSRCITPSLWLLTEFFSAARYCFRSNYKYGSSGQNCTPRPAWLYNCFDDSSTSRTAIAPASILLAFCRRGKSPYSHPSP